MFAEKVTKRLQVLQNGYINFDNIFSVIAIISEKCTLKPKNNFNLCYSCTLTVRRQNVRIISVIGKTFKAASKGVPPIQDSQEQSLSE